MRTTMTCSRLQPSNAEQKTPKMNVVTKYWWDIAFLREEHKHRTIPSPDLEDRIAQYVVIGQYFSSLARKTEVSNRTNNLTST